LRYQKYLKNVVESFYTGATYPPPPPNPSPIPQAYQSKTKYPRGYNDTGKVDFISPNYSSLTTGLGSFSSIYSKENINKPPPEADFGRNTWIPITNPQQQEYEAEMAKKYSGVPSTFYNIPNYPLQSSVTGLYLNNNVPAANSIFEKN
jgi:hypothetical protein